MFQTTNQMNSPSKNLKVPPSQHLLAPWNSRKFWDFPRRRNAMPRAAAPAGAGPRSRAASRRSTTGDESDENSIRWSEKCPLMIYVSIY